MRTLVVALIAACLFCQPPAAHAGEEIKATFENRIKVGLTVYNGGFGLVRDTREVDLPKGGSILAFVDISSQIQPETARLLGQGIVVLEQNYDFDLLSPEALLRKHVGRRVGLVRTHPTTGEDKLETGTLLSLVNREAVFKIGDRIETVGSRSPYRFVFQDIPPNLRVRPTLSMLLQAQAPGKKKLTLSYLSQGLNWSTDYVAVMAPDGKSIDLKGWVTMINTSGSSYEQAELQLMAGDVGRVQEERYAIKKKARAMAMESAPAAPRREKLFEYHLYTIPRPVDIRDNQTKQIELLRAAKIPVVREYVIDSAFDRHDIRPGSTAKKLKTRVMIKLKNEKPGLGLPLPAGVVRLSQADSKGDLQFVGEDRIGHTPEGRELSLRLGNAFDVTGTREMVDYKKVYGREIEGEWKIVVFNAKDEAIEVKILERIYGQWEILEESHPHAKKSASAITWKIKVPAKSKTELKYKARIK